MTINMKISMKIEDVSESIEDIENEAELMMLSGHFAGESDNPEIRKPEKTSKPVNVIGFDKKKLRMMPRTLKHGLEMFFRCSHDTVWNFSIEIPPFSSVILMMCGGGGGYYGDGGDTLCTINGLQQIAFGGKRKSGPFGGGWSIDPGKDSKAINLVTAESPSPGKTQRFLANKWSGFASTGGGGSDTFGGGCGMFVDFQKSKEFSGSLAHGGFLGGSGEQLFCGAIGFGGGRLNAGGGGFIQLNFESPSKTIVINGSVPDHNKEDSTGGSICIWF